MRILYDSKLTQFKSPFGVLTPGQDCTLHMMLPVSICTVSVQMLLLDEKQRELQSVALAKQQADALYETWGGAFSIAAPGLYFYYFRVTTKNESFRLYKQGNDTNMEAGDLWQVSCVDTSFPVPQALRGAVMYQIFPDRFAAAGQCDCKDKLQPYWVHENRGDVPVWQPDANGEVLNNDFYGGNLNGIREKLPYLRQLGVEILYLNPIFMAWSNHRYDTYDYRRVDPMLGTEADFTALCAAAHQLGMKIVLDGVFSHVGSRSPYFQSAIHDANSPYRSWFSFQHYPDVYTSWWGITTLPCVSKLEPSYMDYIIRSADSVVAHWLALGADGFRLDVVDELPDEFVLCLRRRIRELNPDAILLGEVWEDASNKEAYGVRRRYFADRELDGVMNYPWRKAILRYVRGEDDGAELGERVMTLAENYPADVLSGCMTLLSTHDTPRAITELVDPSDADRAELARRHMDAETYRRASGLLRMAAFLQFTLPGAPCIYYGDEAGMTGYRDPFNRMFYPWGCEDTALRDFYRALTALRQKPALRTGSVTVLDSGGGRFSFRRTLDGERTLFVCCNRAHDWTLTSARGRLLLGGGIADYTPGRLTLAPGGFAILEEA